MSPVHDEPGSRPPLGVDPPSYLVDLDAALQVLHESEYTKPVISVLMAFYLRGQTAAMKEFSLRQSTLYKLREQGEAVVRGYLVAVQDMKSEGMAGGA